MTASPSVLPLQLGGGGYQISRSVRLRSSASAYLNRTMTTPTNANKWTWSGWVKRGSLGGSQNFFAAGQANTFADFGAISFSGDSIYIPYDVNGTVSWYLLTTSVYRDPSAWYHIVVYYDSTQATAANRVLLYVNGVQVTAFSSATYPTQNTSMYINTARGHAIGNTWLGATVGQYFDGYLAEVNFIDGQALTASSFGYTDSNGIWQPKAYTGTYGTNGFYLKFTDNSAATAAAIGKDYSGNGNNWTPNNISVTAGTTYDSMIDSPTVGYGASNYAVLNPLSKGAASTYANGNLQVVTGLATSANFATIQIPDSGKWYWEYVGTATGDRCYCGIANSANTISVAYYGLDGNKYINGTGSAYGATYTTNDVIGVAVDVNSGSITFYKNNVSQGAITQTIAGNQFFPYFADGAGGFSSTIEVNFGQRPFSYTPPAGFAALNTYNLPTATINNGATVMAASTYTANGGVQTVLNSANNAASVSFQPDLFWIKPRSAVGSNILANTIVGVSKYVYSDQAVSEVTNANYITSANSNGFSLGSANYAAGTTMVGWQWQAGQGTTSSNTNGSITSTVSVNQSAGFSVVTYTGTLTGTPGSMPTVGHGLGVAPKLIISKSRNVIGVDSGAWFVWTGAIATDNYLRLNTTAAAASVSGGGGGTMVAPTSTVFSTPYISGTNINANNYVAYCWSEVAGYSKFGSYTGNGSTDGPFVYCGFRPRWLMIKRTDTTGGWTIWDTSRDTYNIAGNELQANTSAAEATSQSSLDILSNGIKLRNTYPAENASGGTYIFAAFAENPLNISRAR